MKKLAVVLAISVLPFWGCSGKFWGGAAAGAAGAGAAYEIQAKRQMDQLEEDLEEGRITREEYESRRRQIEKGSIIY